MAENKTKATSASVDDYIAAIADETRRNDAHQLISIMSEITGLTPVMWGAGIVGFGSYHYKSAAGREGDMLKVGFAARKDTLVLYGVIFYGTNTQLLETLGKHKQGTGCLYIKKLSDVDLAVLRQMIDTAYNSPGQNTT